MRSIKRGVAVALGFSVALLAINPVAAVASSGKKSTECTEPTQETMAGLSEAMHDEAFAYAQYLAFGAVASPKGQTSLSKLYQRTAEVELQGHFSTLASLACLVGTTAENLTSAIEGEDYETTDMYVRFAQEAYADGDIEAGDLFSEIGEDEATHRDMFAQALTSLSGHPAGHKSAVPVAPAPDAVPILAGDGSGLSPRTLENLSTAMHGEAFAYASYMLYADQAQRSGLPAIAKLFRATAQIELEEHFRELANLAGMVSDNATNLQVAIDGEVHDSTVMYPRLAMSAIAAGDYTVASALLKIRDDEATHVVAFTAELAKLR
ncbi:MAG: hypothetical protein FWD18_03185 [Micrococcales bacterium]|nr:hypothetical protein [Micrococcales bacterium]